jgi:vitamin B12 transporter
MVLLCATAAAEEPPVEVWGDAPEPDDGGARVTSIDPRDLPASADLATAAARAPGVVVRRLGGLGDPAQIGLRGSGARHTEVWFDGVPLNPEGGEALDVSDLPLVAFERVDVLRGPTPTGAGVPAIGGALWLVSRRDTVESLELSAGSYGASRGALVEGGRRGLLVVDGLTTAGDFRWYDDRSTQDVGDDRLVRRANNDARRVSTLGRLDLGPVTALHAATVREDGVPGFTSEPPTAEATYGLHRQLVGLAGRAERGASVWTGSAWGVWRRERFVDPAGEVALAPTDATTTTWSVGGAPGWRSVVAPGWRAEVALHGRLEGVATAEGDVAAPGRQRAVGRAQVGLPWSPGPVTVWPTALVVGASPVGAARASTTLLLPRAAVRWDVGPVALSATGGASGRPPDLLELFGDRGAQVGNPDLRPERGWGADVGVAAHGRARAELVGFWSQVEDLVVWIPTPQGVARPQNVDRTRTVGLEGTAGVDGEAGAATLSATVLDARRVDPDPTYDGRRLPRVPLAEAVLAGHVDPGPLELGADVSATSATFADPANLVPEAPRLLLGATLRAAPAPSWRLELDVRNAAGARSARVPRDPLVDDGTTTRRALEDFGGYPLPGRTVTLSLRVGS